MNIIETAKNLVQGGDIPKNSPLGILGMINSPYQKDRVFAVAKILGAPNKVQIKDSKDRYEIVDIERLFEQEDLPLGWLTYGLYAGVKS